MAVKESDLHPSGNWQGFPDDGVPPNSTGLILRRLAVGVV